MAPRRSPNQTGRLTVLAFLVVALVAACAPDVPSAATALRSQAVAVVSLDAAPAAIDDMWDLTDQGKQNYFAWYDYERQTSADRRSERELHSFGLAACINIDRGIGLDVLERSMSKAFGLTRSGAQAVIRAALESLCKSLDYGYKTAFDSKVDQFRFAALDDPALQWTIEPQEWDFGNFMRGSCDRYWAAGMSNIDIYLFENRSSYPLIAGATDTTVIRILLSHSMWPGCGKLYLP